MSEKTILSVKDIVKTYPGVVAIDHVSFDVREGEVHALIGENGAGKSTLIKTLSGAITPDSGTITIDGKSFSSLTPATAKEQGISVIYQEFTLIPGISAAENVFLGEKTTPGIFVDIKDRERRTKELFDQMGVSLDPSQKVRSLSPAMQQIVEIAKAISKNVKILIMDEPTAGLDVEARNEILDLLREYAAEDESRTILITSHIASDLEHLCDDIYLIHGGKQLLHEETDVILEQYGLIKADEAQYAALDKEYLLDTQKEPYGYACLTNDRKYYEENVPDLVVERAGIDDVILMMTGGEKR